MQNYYHELLQASAKHIRGLARLHLPNSTHKQFIDWVLDKKNPFQKDYLRMLGVEASVSLTISLLGKTIEEKTLKNLLNHAAFMNVYAAFEGSSDNIAFGLANRHQTKEKMYDTKRKVLIDFNQAMISRLKGDTRSTIELLNPVEANGISAYAHSLHPEEFRQLAKKYQEFNKHTSLEELEYSVLSVLILNVAACLCLNTTVKDHAISEFLHRGLIDRYVLVKSQIEGDNPKDLESLIASGTKTILIMQMLAFCIGVFDQITSNPKLLAVIEDGFLEQVLYDAALLVRLLNDVGTELLNLSPEKQTAFFNDLKQNLQSSKTNSIYEFLDDVSDQDKNSKLMTRIRKDIVLQEFNISLDRLSEIPSPELALEQFSNDIRFCSDLFQKHHHALIMELEILKNRLGDSQISNIIANFVIFHEKIYALDYENPQGDYMFFQSDRNDKKMMSS